MRKPIHKHIGHGIRKAHQKVTKYLVERDTLFATLWVFLFIIILGSLPINLGILNPVKLGLKDFDFNDVYYSKLAKKDFIPLDSNIVIINIGRADRQEIAMLIDKTASYEPKVMGLDVLFHEARDPETDSLLRASINRHPNLVLATMMMTDHDGKLKDSLNIFRTGNSLSGYVNFPTEGDYETVRTYYPFKSDDHDHEFILPSFTSSILKIYNEKAYEHVSHKVNKPTIINYRRNLNGGNTQKYRLVSGEQLLLNQVDSSYLRGAIALLAYVNEDPNDIEDKKFTPMNPKYAGKTVPDMNGIVVHANILSMALEDNFIKKVPGWGNWLLAIIICWLHMSFFIHYYLESHIWFHLAAKIAQVLSAIFFVWLGIYIFKAYQVKVDMKLSLITIVMAVDVIYFYEAWATWMHKKYLYRTVFKPHHH